jgi:hypothetical protein
MKPQTRSTKISKASRWAGSLELAMTPKLVVPVRAFHPLSLFRISSAREMCRCWVDDGESLPTSLA